MKTDYTPTTEEEKGAYHKHRYYSDPRFRYSLGSLEEFDRWLAELIRKEREEAWDEGFEEWSASPVGDQPLWDNPYSNGSNET